MGPPTAPQQRKGPEQNDPPLAAADSTGRGKTSQPAPPPPTASFIPAVNDAWNAQMEGSTRTRSPQKQQMAAEGAVTRNEGAVTRNRSKKDMGAAVVSQSSAVDNQRIIAAAAAAAVVHAVAAQRG